MEKTILHILLERRNLHENHSAIQFKDQSKWVKYNWREYFSLIDAVGAFLIQSGIQPGDRIALMSETRPEWIIADLAIMGVGAITVPIYPNNLDEDVEFILNNCCAKFIFLEGQDQLNKWLRIKNKCSLVQDILLFERNADKTSSATESNGNLYLNWFEALNKGREYLKSQPQAFIDLAKQTQLTDTSTILYTSGTTGRPKGVVLTHTQIMSELIDIFNMVTVNEDDTTLSFLPYSHILGRVEAWGNVYCGYTLAFAESIDRIKANLKEVKPTFMIAVPRIFEKIYSGILAQVENVQIKRKLFEKALTVARKVSDLRQANQPMGILLTLEYEALKVLLFNPILEAMGGRMRFAVSGGAPLSSDIAKFFHGIGLLICEGYGLTETTAGICFNSPTAYKFGTVGRPLADVKLKIAEDGEILVKSKKNMIEYYKNPEATAEAFTDGFFKTGDIGHIDSEGFLHITDRKKDLIKTAGGKYVAPQKLENLLKANPNISNVLIHGDQKKYIIALITVSPALAKDAQSPEVYNIIKNAVADANENLASFESIKKFAILPHDFTIEGGELTPSLKVKRRYCDNKYKEIIDSLY